MPIDLIAYGKLRPYLYHLTHAENLARLRRTRVLESATALATRAGQPELLGARRRTHVPLRLGADVVILRDQAPLHKGNMRLEDGWTYESFVRHINDRVYFWPGGEKGPIAYGQRHYSRYEAEEPAIIRVRFDSLCNANPHLGLWFAKCNSGSPRWSQGVPGKRGGGTFVPASKATFGHAAVVEVTVNGSVCLPGDSEVGPRPSGPWSPLFG